MKKIIILFIFSLFLASCSQVDNGSEQPVEGGNNSQETNNNPGGEEDNNTQNGDATTPKDNSNQNGQTETLTKSKAEKILNQYKDIFMGIANNSSEDGIVENYNSKEDLISHFTSIMSKDLAQWYAESYFKEENNQLILKAMDAPTWLVNDKPFTLEKASGKNYNVIQERNNELLGHVNMIYKLTLQDEKWIVNSIEVERLDTETEKTTITKNEAIASVRQSLRISEESNRIVEFDHRNEDGDYIIHVYDKVEREDGWHTSTYGWYIVDKKNGTVENMMG